MIRIKRPTCHISLHPIRPAAIRGGRQKPNSRPMHRTGAAECVSGVPQAGPKFALPQDMSKPQESQPSPPITAASVGRRLRRLGVFILGSVLLAAGLAMIVLPGPAFIVVPAALGLLATEFEWADHWRVRALEWLGRLRDARKPVSNSTND